MARKPVLDLFVSPISSRPWRLLKSTWHSCGWVEVDDSGEVSSEEMTLLGHCRLGFWTTAKGYLQMLFSQKSHKVILIIVKLFLALFY